jgi:hypothetical protein
VLDRLPKALNASAGKVTGAIARWRQVFSRRVLLRLPRVEVAAWEHATALYRPCGSYPRCEVLAVAAGSVREAGRKRRAHALLHRSRPPGPWRFWGQSYLLRRHQLPPRVAAHRGLPLQPLARRSWRSPLMRSSFQLFASRSELTGAHPADGQRATVLRAPLSPLPPRAPLSPLPPPPADRPISPAAV